MSLISYLEGENTGQQENTESSEESVYEETEKVDKQVRD